MHKFFQGILSFQVVFRRKKGKVGTSGLEAARETGLLFHP
jgi:hypothetical protein